MKRRFVLLTALQFLTSVAILAGNEKLSTWLTLQLLQQSHQQRAASENVDHDMLITTFVRLTEEADKEVLTKHGCKVYAQLGDIYIVTIPMSQLETLLSLEEVLRIEANTTCHTTMDSVAKVVNVLPCYQSTSQRTGYTGKGVVVGVMDVGFDLTHPNFYSNEQLEGYRIKAFWDQLAGTTGHEAGPVGRTYTTAEDILAAGCSTDGKIMKHGTHTTGIAAGAGYTTPYRGIAYDSDLCLVANAVVSDTCFIEKSNYNLYTSATDALGFKYIFDYAEQQGKPCVISFSEGYTPYMDEDDELYNEFLKRLIGPGRILVASAGNESLSTTYMQKTKGITQAGCFVDTYYEDALYRVLTDGTPTLHLLGYSGPETVGFQRDIVLDAKQWENGTIVDSLFMDKDTVSVTISSYSSALTDGKTMYQMELYGNRVLNDLWPIAMVIEGDNDESILYGSRSYALKSHEWDTRWTAARRGRNVFAPGCLEAPICVGATTWRIECTNLVGEVIYDTSGNQSGLVATFSSFGPTMDGRSKPEVVAPGKNVISSLNSYYLAENPDVKWDIINTTTVNERTYPWGINSGTSMSTPVVAGAIALWLQAKPTLTREEIVTVLQNTCKHNDTALSYPNDQYGYGEIDIEKGLDFVINSTGISDMKHTEELMQHEGIYDLQGRRISKPTKRGVYIVNGKLRIY